MALKFLSLFFLCVPFLAQAQSNEVRPGERFYGAAYLDWQTVAVDDASFEPRLATIAAGFWMWQGIGLEAEFGTSYAEDSFSGLELDVSSQTSLTLRLESPPSSGYSAYFQLGMARTEIESRYSVNNTVANRPVKTTLTGPRFSLGMLVHVNRWMVADAGFSRLVYEDDAGVNLFRLGLRLTLGRPR